jgi:hypothetical protein
VFVSFEHPQNTGKKAVPPFPSQIIREFSGLAFFRGGLVLEAGGLLWLSFFFT